MYYPDKTFLFTRFKPDTYLKQVIAAILFLILLLFGLYLSLGKLFYTNTSASAPAGVYMVVPGSHSLNYGDYAIVRCPLAIPSLHVPQNSLLIKKASALPGDTYTVTQEAVYVQGTMYPVYPSDQLPHNLSPGTHTVPEHTVFFLNDPPLSLDSRYFGPVPQDHIIHRVVLLLDFTHLEQALQNTTNALQFLIPRR